jgi:precorrin-3B C17-methyltransferase
MVKPRGYANKYDLDDGGSTRIGEKAGRSLSTGLLGWMENLRLDYLEGASTLSLATRHGLPQDYIEWVLSTPQEVEEALPAEQEGTE